MDIPCLIYEGATVDIDRRIKAEFTAQSEALVEAMDVQLNDDYGNRSLVMIENGFSLQVFYTFLDYETCIDKRNELKGSISQLACLVAWMATLASCLTRRESRGGCR